MIMSRKHAQTASQVVAVSAQALHPARNLMILLLLLLLLPRTRISLPHPLH
jgi:hypothetical protein